VIGTGVVDIVREVQIPLLAVLLTCGAAAKAAHTTGGRSPEGETGPTMIFPLRLRRSTAIGLCAAEFVLGFGLLLTAGGTGAGIPALAVRVATALLFSTAVGALHVLRDRQPEAGCGCFGELSHTPVSLRTIARTGLLCVAALCTIGLPPLRMPASAGQAGLTLAVIAAEIVALVALSPEVGEILTRMSHADPCELREVPLARTISALKASAPWRRYRRHLVTERPVDVWREGCWRFMVFPGVLGSRRVEMVFAVYLAGRRAPVRVGMLDVATSVAEVWHAPAEDSLQESNRVYEKANTAE
jgi:hypothetical protein